MSVCAAEVCCCGVATSRVGVALAALHACADAGAEAGADVCAAEGAQLGTCCCTVLPVAAAAVLLPVDVTVLLLVTAPVAAAAAAARSSRAFHAGVLSTGRRVQVNVLTLWACRSACAG